MDKLRDDLDSYSYFFKDSQGSFDSVLIIWKVETTNYVIMFFALNFQTFLKLSYFYCFNELLQISMSHVPFND